MRTIIIISIIFYNILNVSAQTFPSSCVVSDSVKSAYYLDANQLALRMIINQNLPSKDSIEVPEIYINQVARELYAVYNLETSERDTVIKLFNTHAFPTTYRGDILSSVFFNSNPIADSLQVIPEVDSFCVKYNIYLEYTHTLGGNTQYIYDIDPKYNQKAIINFLEPFFGSNSIIPDVGGSGVYGVGPQTDIKREVFSNYSELEYRYLWGDCEMGCAFNHNWRFRIYPDCSVEYLGGYGDQLPTTLAVTTERQSEVINVYPNPATDKLNISIPNNQQQFIISIFDITGKKVQDYNYYSSEAEGNIFEESIDISNLSEGLYLCKFSFDGKQILRKFIKQ